MQFSGSHQVFNISKCNDPKYQTSAAAALLGVGLLLIILALALPV